MSSPNTFQMKRREVSIKAEMIFNFKKLFGKNLDPVFIK